MSSRFKTIRSNRKWMIKSKVPPPSLSDCHFLSPSPFISSRLSLFASSSLHKFSVIHHRSEICVDGWLRSRVRSWLVFFLCVCICGKSVLTRWKKRQSNNIIIIADVIRNSSLFCSEVRLQCERERKKEPNTFTNTHTNAKAHAQIDPLYLNLSCPVGC